MQTLKDDIYQTPSTDLTIACDLDHVIFTATL